jgi:hypothetical protein
VITLLVDHHLEGKARRLERVLSAGGWDEFAAMRFVSLSQVGLAIDSSDRVIWRFAQTHGMLLLTDNRNMKGIDSLEQTLREENSAEALPVITIVSSSPEWMRPEAFYLGWNGIWFRADRDQVLKGDPDRPR